MKKIYLIFVLALALNSCDFLDVVPDNIPTLEHAFNLRSTAERFLFTCYSYLPANGTYDGNLCHTAGDEFWLPITNSTNAWYIARGYQKVNDPYMNYWQGRVGGTDIYEAIRQCNIFLENIDRVPDMTYYEKEKWIGEVYFLKAYYHFYLLRLFGPVPLIKENVPVNAEYGDVYPTQNTIDECFDYIEELLDEAIKRLPDAVYVDTEYGRITKAIALSQKAIVLTEAASPLFNGNNDYTGFKNMKGQELFNTQADITKWEKAAAACKRAIEFCCDTLGHKLYTYTPDFALYELSDTMKIQMSIRNSVCESWNPEIIWGNTNSYTRELQRASTPRGLDPTAVSNPDMHGFLAPTIKMAELFYSENGVPIEDDIYYDYASRYGLGIGGEESKLYIKEGYVTANLHFNREPRFYASLGFDGGIWYGQGHEDDSKADDLLYVSAKYGEPCAAQNAMRYSVTGYWAKKLVYFKNDVSKTSGYDPTRYPWPEIRLANLYLLYAEAANEANNGPTEDAFKYINEVRERAGLEDVKTAWSTYTNRSDYETYAGFQRIVRRERLIELAFEGQRYWDIRRWKEATTEFNKPVTGWDLEQEDADSYYRQKTIFNQSFSSRDYFWPVPETELFSNKNLIQFPGW